MTKSSSRITPRAVAALAGLLLAGGLSASTVTFSPLPPVAGEPFRATFHGSALTCEDTGQLQVASVADNVITLEVTPPACDLPPAAAYLDYTASTEVGPLDTGNYTVRVLQDSGGGPVVQVSASLAVWGAPVCEATASALCLTQARFEVTATWENFTGGQGEAHAMPQTDIGGFGVMWFFNPENPELLVKVLDGCSVNGHFWVFISPASTVRYDVSIFDVGAGVTKTYTNPLGSTPRLFADTSAFPCAAAAI